MVRATVSGGLIGRAEDVVSVAGEDVVLVVVMVMAKVTVAWDVHGQPWHVDRREVEWADVLVRLLDARACVQRPARQLATSELTTLASLVIARHRHHAK